MKKLEITQKLEQSTDLDSTITILNLPGANFCEKRSELLETLELACKGCIANGFKNSKRLSIQEIREVIDFFVQNYGTKFITINGRGDPFHPILKQETLEKIRYAYSLGAQAYVFTAGNNLDRATCDFLAEHKTNVAISLFGNSFIDANFFSSKQYPTATGRIQNQRKIAENLRRLIQAYPQEQGLTKLAMNYVISETDLQDKTKVLDLKQIANKEGIAFVCNTDFNEVDPDIRNLAKKYSDFNLPHSTFVNGRCQIGAGSSATVDSDGTLYRCPYLTDEGDGNIKSLTEKELKMILDSYMQDRKFVCVYRKT